MSVVRVFCIFVFSFFRFHTKMTNSKNCFCFEFTCLAVMAAYLFVENALNFTAAQSYCQDELATDLVSIHNQIEYDELIASVKSYHSAAMEL